MVLGATGYLTPETFLAAGMFLAEDPPQPANLYGPIALGGLGIFVGSVLSAFLVGALVRGMSEDEIQEVTSSLSGGRELERLKEEKEVQQEKFRALERDMQQSKTSTSASVAQGEVSSQGPVEQQAKSASGDLSVDDEYD